MVAAVSVIKPMAIIIVPISLGPISPYPTWIPFSTIAWKNLYIVNPKEISEIQVLTQAISVLSYAATVRDTAICVLSDAS